VASAKLVADCGASVCGVRSVLAPAVGTRNLYHHPRAEVLKRLQQAKALTFRTDTDGATSFYLDGKTVTSQLQGLR